MNHCVTLKLEDDTVRFTPDGRIAVIDAIGAVCDAKDPAKMWEDLKHDHPSIVEMCRNYTFSREGTASVVDSEGWMAIQTRLLERIVDTGK